MTDADWIKQERDHEYRMATVTADERRRRREATVSNVQAIATGATIVLIVAILAGLIYYWQDSSGKRGNVVEVACVQSGGTWTSVGGSQNKVCIHIDGGVNNG